MYEAIVLVENNNNNGVLPLAIWNDSQKENGDQKDEVDDTYHKTLPKLL